MSVFSAIAGYSSILLLIRVFASVSLHISVPSRLIVRFISSVWDKYPVHCFFYPHSVSDVKVPNSRDPQLSNG
jgi:hypothetical protein